MEERKEPDMVVSTKKTDIVKKVKQKAGRKKDELKVACIQPEKVEEEKRDLDSELDELERLIFGDEYESRKEQEAREEKEKENMAEEEVLVVGANEIGLEGDQQEGKKRTVAALETEELSIKEMIAIPEKQSDQGAISIPFKFDNLTVLALVDSGASSNFMPFSLYSKLGFPHIKKRNLRVKLASQEYTYPLGVVEDVLIHVDTFTYLTDFVIIDMPEDDKFPIIVGRPFLKTAKAFVDFEMHKIILKRGNRTMTFPRHKFEMQQEEIDLQTNVTDFCDENVLEQDDEQVNMANLSQIDLLKHVTERKPPDEDEDFKVYGKVDEGASGKMHEEGNPLFPNS